MSQVENPVAVLFDTSGTEKGTPSNPIRVDPTGTTPQPVSGTVSVSSIVGPVPVTDNGGSLTVDGTVTANAGTGTFAVSAASLPLPTGAATETTLASINTKTPALGQAAMAASTPVVIASNQTGVPVTDNGGSLTVDGSVSVTGSVAVTGPLTDTQLRATAVPVSAASLPLPAGAATSALQTTGNSSLSSIDSKTPALGQAVMTSSTPVVIASNQTAIPVSDGGGSVTVDGTVAISGSVAVTGPLTDAQLRATAVPVSGTITSNVGTTGGLALDTTLTSGSLKATARGGAKGTTTAADVTSTNVDANTQALDVSIKGTSSVTVTGSVAVTGPLTDTQLRATAVPVSTAALPLPAGAATSALQTTGNSSLSSIDSKTPALGQAAMAASTPVVIASNQTAIPVTDNGGSLTVDGTVAVSSVSGSVAVTGPLTDAQLRATAVPVSGAITSNIGATGGLALDATLTSGSLKATTRGGAKGTTTAADVTSTNVDANTQALDVSIKGTSSVTVSGSVAVTGPLTDTQLRATAVPVSGTVTANAGTGTFAVSAASLPLPAGAATETTLASINTKIPALGQAAMAASTPVVIASNQTAITVNQGTFAGGASAWQVTLTDSANQIVKPGDLTNNALRANIVAGSLASLAAVTTLPPTYTNGTDAKLSMDTQGRLRTTDSNLTSGTAYVQLWDGLSSNQATIKAPNTAPTAVDTALVASLSPNGNIVRGSASDNSTNSTQKIPVISALAGSIAPAWTSGNMVPLSVDTSGNLRVSGSFSATNPSVITVGATSPTSATHITALVGSTAPTYGNAEARPLSLNAAGALRVDGSAVTQPISAVALPLPTGAALSSLQTTGNSSLASIDSKLPALGQSVMSQSLPVAIASNQTAIPVTDNGGSLTVDGSVTVSGTVTANAGSGTFSVTPVSPVATSYLPVRLTNGTNFDEPATFRALASNIAVANNKHLFSIVNGSVGIVKITQIKIINVQTTAVTGIMGTINVARIASHAAGTTVTPNAMDTNDTLLSGITALTNATATAGVTLFRTVVSTDEWATGAIDSEGLQAIMQTLIPIYQQAPGTKPLTLRNGQGITVQFVTNSAVGTFDIEVEFTQE